MPSYFYIAKSFDGRTNNGVLAAQDEHQLAQSLKGQGMVLVKAFLEQKGEKSRWNISLPLFGVSSVEKIMMTRNLGVMFSTGLSLVKTFDILASQAKNARIKSALSDIKDKINKGETLSDALKNYPMIFSELFVSMVKVGEESGTLEEVFQILSLQLGKEHDLKSKIKNAMIYPALIVMVMIVIGIIMVTFVLPSLTVFFKTLNANIPIYTRILLAVGNFLSVRWYLLLVIPFFIAMLVVLLLKTKKGKQIVDTLLLRLPLISPIIKKNNAAFLVRSLSSMVAAGVPLVRSLEIASETMGNHYFKEAAAVAAEKIKKGEKLSTALKTYERIFPFGVVEMVEVGEETGKTSSVLKKLADFYEQEAINGIEKLTALIEPMLIIVLGLAVGLFAFSIIQPMYSSLQFINK